MKSLAIIGFGSFGQFISEHLRPILAVTAYDITDKSQEAKERGLNFTQNLKEACQADMIMVAVPVQFMEQTLMDMAKVMNPKAIVMDVASVKVKPVELMLKHLPETAEIIASHPMFGPESGANGIRGLKIVTQNIRSSFYDQIKWILSENLGLEIIEITAEEHDKQMAFVQGLTHWISRAVQNMDLPETKLQTVAYKHFLTIGDILKNDSMDLFLTIERENPYAEEARQHFIEHLMALENKIIKAK